MHIVEVHCQSERGAVMCAGIGIDPAADLRAFEGKIDQRLHAHRLGDIEHDFERFNTWFNMRPGLGDVFGPAYATTNYGIQYTSKGVAAIFAGWGAAKVLETTGSWMPVFWIAVACDLAAALLALVWLKPLLTTTAGDAAALAGGARAPR